MTEWWIWDGHYICRPSQNSSHSDTALSKGCRKGSALCPAGVTEANPASLNMRKRRWETCQMCLPLSMEKHFPFRTHNMGISVGQRVSYQITVYLYLIFLWLLVAGCECVSISSLVISLFHLNIFMNLFLLCWFRLNMFPYTYCLFLLHNFEICAFH